MKVHFIRHAQAVEHSADLSDALRNLTCRGRERFRQVAACLKKMAIDPGIIITSPKIRAVQTAEILAETLSFSGEVRIAAELAVGPDIAVLDRILRKNSAAAEVVIVGHEPGLGETIGGLLQLASPCHLPKGGVVSLKIFLKRSGLAAEMTGLITGGGKVIRKPDEAMKRLLNINSEEVTP